MNVITKILVSETFPFSGVELDLQDDAIGIEVKQTNKDMQDITKVFVSVSKTITLPPTPANRRAFKNFDNLKIVGGTGKLYAKILTNGVCVMTGTLVLKQLNYDEDGFLKNYACEFQTITPSLSERLGDDLIWDLGNKQATDTYVQGTQTSASVGNTIVKTTIDTITNTYYTFDIDFNADSVFENAVKSVQVGVLKATVYQTLKTTTQTDTYANPGHTGNYISTYKVAYTMSTISTTNDTFIPKWYTPLASKYREWQYGGVGIENINTPSGAVSFNELFPAVSFQTILYLLFKKYDLRVDFPLANSMAISELFMLANNGGSSYDTSIVGYFKSTNLTPTAELMAQKDNFFPYSKMPTKPIFTNEFHNGQSVTVVDFGISSGSPDNYAYMLSFELKGFISDTENDIKLKMISLGSEKSILIPASGSDELGVPTLVYDWDSVQGRTTALTSLYKRYFLTILSDGATSQMTGKYYITYTSTKPIILSSFKFSFDQYARTTSYGKKKFNYWRLDSVGNFTNQTATNNIDLIKKLPNMKVKDFLQSLIKTFNISIYDTNPNNDTLSFLTVLDIDGDNKSYKKNTVDYTPFFNPKKNVLKVRSNDFTAYKFSHGKSKLKANEIYLTLPESEGVSYGAVQYPIVQSSKDIVFDIQSNFVVVPQNVLSNFYFYKWFENGEPTIVPSKLDGYKTVYDEPIIFYPKNNQSLSPFFYNKKDGTKGILTSYLNSGASYELNKTGLYLPPFTPSNGEQNFSVGGSILFSQNEDINTQSINVNSLYAIYFEKFITQILKPKTLSSTMFFFLPQSELYISTDANGNESGFRMQNEIVVGEEKYSILESNINYITGETKLIIQNRK